MFRALIALDAEAPGHGVGQYASPTHSLMLRAARLSLPACHRLFRAEVCWDDHQLLKPGDRAVVTIEFADDDAEMYFAAGQRFTIWADAVVGRSVQPAGLAGSGVISQCVSPPAPRFARQDCPEG